MTRTHHKLSILARSCRTALFALAVFLVSASLSAAPTATARNASPAVARGTVEGYVLNGVTGQYLEGAVVTVQGSITRAMTERGGGYSLTLPAGAYVLSISYPGMNTEQIPVDVAAGQTTTRRVELSSETYTLQAFTVTGQREGQAAAIQQQRNADNLKTVVSTDAFGNPASNPGELLQRLSGVSVEYQGGEVRNFLVRGFTSDWATLMIDGAPMASSEGSVNTRQVNIAQLSTNNLDSIELIKAPTADMDANAVAGYVNVRTKRAFDRSTRVATLSAGTRWTDFTNKDIRGKDKPEFDSLSLAFGDVFSVFGGKRNLGLFLTAGYRSSPLLLDEVGSFQNLTITNHFLLPTATNGLTSPIQRQFGTGTLFYPSTRNLNLGFNVDYKLSENTYVYAKTTFNEVNNLSDNSGLARFTLSSLFTTSASFAPGSSFESSEVLATAGNSTARLISQLQRKTMRAYAFSSGIEHKMPSINAKLNVDMNYSLAKSGYPINSFVTATMVDRIGWKVDRRAGTDEFHPSFQQTAGPSIYDPANYTLATAFRQVYDIPNEIMGLRSDFRINLPSSLPSYLKIGGKLHQNILKYKNTPEYFTYAGAKGVGGFLAPPSKSGDNLYGPFPMIQGAFSGLEGDPFANMSNWTKSASDAYNTAFYGAGAWNSKTREKIYAGYLLGSVQWGKLRIVPGVRAEATAWSAKARLKNQSAAWGGNLVTTLSPAENAERARRAVLPEQQWSQNYSHFFPNLHLIYEPWGGFQIRASYNKTITRPPILTLVPQGMNVNLDTQTITTANPDLQPYTSNNFEFAVQKYFKKIGSFEINLFRKDITNYFRTIQTFVGDGPDNGFEGQYVGYRLNQVLNVGAAQYRGFEVNYQQQLRFLPGFWKDFGLSANFTYTSAEGDFGGTTFITRLANVRPRFGNVAVSYIGHGFDVRLLCNYQGKYYRGGAGATTLWGDAQTMLDLKTVYRFNRRYQIYFEASNLLDENISTYVQEGDLPLYSQKQGTLFAAGVTINL